MDAGTWKARVAGPATSDRLHRCGLQDREHCGYASASDDWQGPLSACVKALVRQIGAGIGGQDRQAWGPGEVLLLCNGMGCLQVLLDALQPASKGAAWQEVRACTCMTAELLASCSVMLLIHKDPREGCI